MLIRMKTVFTDFAKGVAQISAALGFVSLVFGVFLDGDRLMKLLFPPPPLAGAWHGQVEGETVLFCFTQRDRLVWGEFQRPGASEPSSIEGILSHHLFELAYAGATAAGPLDAGLFRLSYTSDGQGELLEGYWKSDQSLLSRDTIQLRRDEADCELRKWRSVNAAHEQHIQSRK